MKTSRAMRVIKTEYKGIKYRSRTEARWAVFMDNAECPFEYEPEGLDLGDAGCYIPDFYLPMVDKFLEIKPSVMVEGRESPVEELAKQSGKDVILMFGTPQVPELGDERFWENGVLYCGTGGVDYGYWFCCCPHCGMVDIQFNGRADRINCRCPRSEHGDKGYNAHAAKLMQSYYAANNAFRF